MHVYCPEDVSSGLALGFSYRCREETVEVEETTGPEKKFYSMTHQMVAIEMTSKSPQTESTLDKSALCLEHSFYLSIPKKSTILIRFGTLKIEVKILSFKNISLLLK